MAYGDDEFNLRLDGANGTTLTSDASAGVWAEFAPAANGRNWMAAQNQDDTAVIYCVAAATQPSNGTASGELKIPANAYYEFDFSARTRWWFRSTGTSTKVMRQVA